ncbi:MAG: helix-turn-helix domain-containing protein, partial [Solirubrobacteraceae bacterium]
GALGPLPLVAEADALAARLSARHLRELDERGQAGREIEDTVSTLLELDRNIEATAAQLHLHRNSVRYRVGRFRELTGLDLRRTEDLVTTWWLLKRRRSARSAAGRSG